MAEDGSLELYVMGGISMESHLFYVDGILLFCRASTKSFTKLKDILGDFYGFSGLSINCSKSHIR